MGHVGVGHWLRMPRGYLDYPIFAQLLFYILFKGGG